MKIKHSQYEMEYKRYRNQSWYSLSNKDGYINIGNPGYKNFCSYKACRTYLYFENVSSNTQYTTWEYLR